LLDHIIAGLPGLMPELILGATFIISIFSGLFLDRWWRQGTCCLTLIGMAAAATYSGLQLTNPSAEPLLFGMVLPDAFAGYIRILIGGSCILFAVLVYANPD